jgi:hypothetical protein
MRSAFLVLGPRRFDQMQRRKIIKIDLEWRAIFELDQLAVKRITGSILTEKTF